ncbi:unnamed protein product, partial [marine sediment metagenome]
SDAILRFKKPIGYLEYPRGVYINNSKRFSFIADFEVVSVALSWHDGDQEHFIGDMQPNSLQSNKFEYLWDTIDIDTGVELSNAEILVVSKEVYFTLISYLISCNTEIISIREALPRFISKIQLHS